MPKTKPEPESKEAQLLASKQPIKISISPTKLLVAGKPILPRVKIMKLVVKIGIE
jgi:hypothetical protein